MKKTISVLILIAATMLGGTYLVHADDVTDGSAPPPAERKAGPGRFLDRMAKVLDLTAAQKEQIGAILKSQHDQNKPLMQKERDLRQQLRTAEKATTFDEATVQGIANNMAQIQAQLIVSRAKAHNQIRSLLTPAQRDLADRLEPEMGHRPGPAHGF